MAPQRARPSHDEAADVQIIRSRQSQVGSLPVRRTLPQRGLRTVGPWCFVDHMGPATIDDAGRGLGVAPHPHIGLQTVTWLLDGEVLHRDSLGTEQVIAPGQLNLMTAGHGVSHSEEGTGRYRGPIQGAQLWIAQPDETRHAQPAFEHFAELPAIDVGHATATVLTGELDGTASPARRDSDHSGFDLALRPGDTTLPLRPDYEHALVVLTGAVQVHGTTAVPGELVYLAPGFDELHLTVDSPTRALLLGGIPLDDPVLIWWNFVARTRDEISAAHRDWTEGHERFGHVDSSRPRTDVDPPIWSKQ